MVHALYVHDGLDLSGRKDAVALRTMFRLAAAANLAPIKTSRQDLNLLSDDRLHQVLRRQGHLVRAGALSQGKT